MKWGIVSGYLSALFLILSTFSSCTIQNRVYRPGYLISWKKSETVRSESAYSNEAIVLGKHITDSIKEVNYTEQDFHIQASIRPAETDKKRWESAAYMFSNKVNKVFGVVDTCDVIVLKNGTEILAREVELCQDEIKYKNCDGLNGKNLHVKTSEVSLIRYSYGAIEVITADDVYPSIFTEQPDQYYSKSKKFLGSTLGSLMLGLLGLYAFGIPLGLLAVFFGISSISKMNRNPGKYTGMTFAILGIIVGFIDIIGVLILLTIL